MKQWTCPNVCHARKDFSVIHSMTEDTVYTYEYGREDGDLEAGKLLNREVVRAKWGEPNCTICGAVVVWGMVEREMNEEKRQKLLKAAEHWRALVHSERDMAEWDKKHGYGDVSSYHHRADLYERTAMSLELEAKTGRVHCTICLGDHPNHRHKDAPSAGVSRKGCAG